MTVSRILIAGIGNIFMGDDAFGSEVARRLLCRAWPEGVRVVDFGIRGFDVAYALMDGCETAILVDAVPRGGQPGTVYVIEPDLHELDDPLFQNAPLQTHAMHPLEILRLVRSLGGTFPRLLLVGCEPADLGPEDEGKLGLSDVVAAAVGRASDVIESLVTDLLDAKPIQPSNRVSTR